MCMKDNIMIIMKKVLNIAETYLTNYCETFDEYVLSDEDISKIEDKEEKENALELKEADNILNEAQVILQEYEENRENSLLLKDFYNNIIEKKENLRQLFKQDVKSDINVLNKFSDKEERENATNIQIAGVILGGIDLRNLQRENNNLGGEIEEYPYNAKQIRMIDDYKELENMLEEIDNYVENNIDMEEDLIDDMEDNTEIEI